jgi:hypothetical protein
MTSTACLVCIISTLNGRSKKRSLGRWALVAGTQQTLSNLFLPFDIYGLAPQLCLLFWPGSMPVLLACPQAGNTKGEVSLYH